MLFSMIEHCDAKYYYYPIRALAEFFVHGESEKALGKRLNSKSLLHYKQNKSLLGRNLILLEFKKLSRGSNISNSGVVHGYSYLYSDTLSEIRKVLSRLEHTQNLDCYILCLKIISQIMNKQ